MRILIVGAGIAGTTLAALLRQRGFEPVLVEKAHDFRQAGYVLGLWPLGSRVLHGLGLYDVYAEHATAMRHYEVRDDAGKLVHDWEIPASFTERYGDVYCIQRWQLLEILRSWVHSLRMGVTVKALSSSASGVTVELSDGDSQEFDLVVGCDGIRSGLRELVFGDVPLHYTGQTGWAFWADPSAAPPTVCEYWATGKFFGIYPVPGALCVFCGTSAPAGAPDPAEERVARVRAEFGGLGGAVPAVLAAMDESQPIFHDDFNDLEMKTWHKGRVLLLGDASAAFLPSAGVGASMAMESAAVLADELSRADASRVELAISLFEKRRVNRVLQLQEESRLLWKTVFVENRFIAEARNLLLGMMSTDRFLKSFEELMEEPI